MDGMGIASLAAALGTALVGGVFFAFSSFVMAGLARLPAPQGIAAMQALNVTAVTPAFMTALFGTALLCLVLAVLALVRGGSVYLVAGAALYVAGAIVVTMICNVPRNNLLAAQDPGSADAARIWSAYLTEWVRWNHVRGVASLAAAACFILALT